MLTPYSEIPYLQNCPRDGRSRPLITFHDGEKWHEYIRHTETDALDIVPVDLHSGHYLAKEAASERDVEAPLLTFLFQHFTEPAGFQSFGMLLDDIENSLGLFRKHQILFKYFEST